MLPEVIRDLRHAARGLLKQRLFTLTAVLTLALGIGVNIAMFSVMDATLFQALPFNEANTLVVLRNSSGTFIQDRSRRRSPDLLDWEQTQVFEGVTTYTRGAANLAGLAGPERVTVTLATPSFFAVLRASPQLGRLFLPEERQPDRTRVAIISDGLWRRQFGADVHVIGRAIQLSGRDYEVVGVMPRGFAFPDESEVWVPLSVPFDLTQLEFLRTAMIETVVARLSPHASVAQAQAVVNTVASRLSSASEAKRVQVVPLRDTLVRSRKPALFILMGMAALVLLIAAANVTNLVLARALTRLNELKLRVALGASPRRIRWQLLIEPLLLATAGGAIGALLAMWIVRALSAAGVMGLNDVREAGMSARVCLVAVGLCVTCGILCGAASILIIAKPAAGAPTSPRASGSRAGARVRKSILTAQIALSFMLLTGAGLMTRSLMRLLAEDIGRLDDHKRTESVLTAQVALPVAEYTTVISRALFVEQLLRSVRMLPGVVSAGVISGLPLEGAAEVTLPVRLSGASPEESERFIQAEREVASPGYFRSMGLAVVRGRDFNVGDETDAPLVAIINERMANRFWPNEDPLGKTVSMPFESRPRTIVGVVQDIRARTLDEAPGAQLYFPYAQSPTYYLTLVLRAGSDNDPYLVLGMREAVKRLNKTVPVYNVKSMTQVRLSSVAPQRDRTLVIGVFGVVAITLAAVGVYGTTAYFVAQRAAELGIRRALGATGYHVFGLVVRQGLALVSGGILIGAVAALAQARLLRGLLFGVSATDAATFSGVAALLLLIATLATIVPSIRAVRIDPASVMRQE